MEHNADKNENIEITNNQTNRKLQKNEDIEKFFAEYFSSNIDGMDFEDAIIKGNRNFCEFFIEALKERQIIANTFIAYDPLKTRTMKIMLFILNIMLYFVVNG